MTMQQAFECGDNDIPFIEGGFNGSCCYTKAQLLKDQNYHPGINQALSDKWQVNSAEPVVLSAEEIIKNAKSEWDKDWAPRHCMNKIAIDSHQNGRLERDLELKELRKAILEPVGINYSMDDWYRKVIIAARNLKPLNRD